LTLDLQVVYTDLSTENVEKTCISIFYDSEHRAAGLTLPEFVLIAAIQGFEIVAGVPINGISIYWKIFLD
jgi:hypothetical protein